MVILLLLLFIVAVIAMFNAVGRVHEAEQRLAAIESVLAAQSGRLAELELHRNWLATALAEMNRLLISRGIHR